MIQAPPVTQKQLYIDTAYDIGKLLIREALWDGDACNWLGSNVDAVNGKFQVVHRTFSTDLYNGTAGIAFFLSELYKVVPDEMVLMTMEGCINQILKNYNREELVINYGLYGGKLGPARVLIDLGKQFSRPEWLAAGWKKVEEICKCDIQGFELDIISGVAGAVPVLLNLFAEKGDPYLKDAAVKCGRHLIDSAQKQDAYWFWQTLEGQQGLTGYSHGAAGIGVALLELYKATQDTSFLQAATYAFAYEGMLYNPQVQNWPDLRDFDSSKANTTAPNYGETWCHGAPGIALSRIRAWQLTGHEAYRKEAESALATTYRSVYTWMTNPNLPCNFSLCHGIAGNTECLLIGSQALGLSQYSQVPEEVARFGIEKYARNKFNWPSGVNDPSGATMGMEQTPGLMLGLSGTGYYYLRVANPLNHKTVLIAS